MRVKMSFDDWLLYDEDGACGIREDAPEEAKKDYEEYLKWKKKLAEEHKKV